MFLQFSEEYECNLQYMFDKDLERREKLKSFNATSGFRAIIHLYSLLRCT